MGRTGLFSWTPQHDAALAVLTRLRHLKLNVNPLLDMDGDEVGHLLFIGRGDILVVYWRGRVQADV